MATSARPANDWSNRCMIAGQVTYDSRFGGPPPPEYYRELARRSAEV